MQNKMFSSFGIDGSAASRLSGGDINDVFKLSNSVFKFNRSSDFPEMLIKEAQGLELLGRHIKTPEVKRVEVNDDYQMLEIEFIEGELKSTNFWQNFGRQLAILHKQTQTQFGLDHWNYIGSLRQSNNYKNSCKDFLIDERLQPMIEMAVNSGEVNYVEAKIIEGFYQRIEEIYPKELPALIHGDLWGGNYICGTEDTPVLIDPAVYYGHREMDIGMMHFFGGFDHSLFEAYNEEFPLEINWKDRIAINQLYPLLVHVNLFGRGYWSQVSQILAPFKSYLK